MTGKEAGQVAGKLLPTKRVEKVWGRTDLSPPFAGPETEPVGEVWFDPPDALPQLLVKYLFTGEKLSVQVHPSDANAPPGAAGKEECWYVLDAEPGASLAVGFTRDVTRDEMRTAALGGSIEGLLAWHEVGPGDFLYIPAGTVHAIGAGLTLVEIQQTSDTTYRLYDYGRPRELHLDEGLKVAHGRPHDPDLRRSFPDRGNVTLVDGPLFRADRLDDAPDDETLARYDAPCLVLPLDGDADLAGTTIPAGACALAPSLAAVERGACRQMLVTRPLTD